MKSTKVLVAAFALGVMAFVPSLQAANAHAKEVDKIARTVGGLSYYQMWKITNILATSHDQVKALPPGDRRAKGEEIRKASMVEVRKNLTAAQQTRFDALTAVTKP